MHVTIMWLLTLLESRFCPPVVQVTYGERGPADFAFGLGKDREDAHDISGKRPAMRFTAIQS